MNPILINPPLLPACHLPRHGVHTPCPLPFLPPFLLTYLDLPLTSPERLQLERRYGGRKVLEKMARDAVEDMSNKTWLQERTRECGGCGVRVEKSHGCNHVSLSHPSQNESDRTDLGS
jgi:E3 ubiquitin-protein ligase RNF14